MRQAKTRRDFLKLAAAGAGLLGLAACAPAAAPAPQATGVPAAATQAPAKAGTKQVLDMWTHFAGANLEIMNKLIEEFRKDNSDIEFKITAYGSGEIGTKLLAAVAGGAPPDIFHAPGWVPPDFAYNGVLATLDDVVKLPVKPLKNFDGITIYNGARYGVPVNGGLAAMCYNKSLLDAAGVKKLPETWDELVEAGKLVTKGSQWGVLIPNKPDQNTSQVGYSLLMAAGGELLTPDGKEPAFNSAAGLETLQFAADLIQKHKIQPVKSYGLLDTWTDYGNGQIGGICLYPVWLANIKTFKFQSVTAQMPKLKGPGAHFAGNYWTLLATKKKEKAEPFKRFTEWWFQPQINARWCKDTGGTPTSQETIDDPVYKKFLQDEPAAKAYIDSLAYAKPFPGVLGVTAVVQIFAETWETVSLGKSTPKDALAAAEKRASEELKRAQKR